MINSEPMLSKSITSEIDLGLIKLLYNNNFNNLLNYIQYKLAITNLIYLHI